MQNMYPQHQVPPPMQRERSPYRYGQLGARTPDPSWTQHLIKKEDRSHDFKTVARGTRTEHRFVLKNRFVETVHIASVSSSCTCATPVIADGNDEIQTNAETAVVVHFHTDRFDGLKSATINVVIDRPYHAEFQLNVRGEIRSDVTITPNSVQFGSVKQGVEASRTFSTVYTGPMASWKIVDVRSKNEHLSAEIVDVEAVPGMITTRVKVTLDANAPRGDLVERLVLVTNDAENRREIPVIVMGRVGTIIKVTPTTLFLGYLKPGEMSPVKDVMIRGTERFRIKRLLCNNPEVQIEMTPNPDDPPKLFYKLPIRYTNPESGPHAPKDGRMEAVVKIETDNPEISPTFNVMMELSKE